MPCKWPLKVRWLALPFWALMFTSGRSLMSATHSQHEYCMSTSCEAGWGGSYLLLGRIRRHVQEEKGVFPVRTTGGDLSRMTAWSWSEKQCGSLFLAIPLETLGFHGLESHWTHTNIWRRSMITSEKLSIWPSKLFQNFPRDMQEFHVCHFGFNKGFSVMTI